MVSVMSCIEKCGSPEFSISEIYQFENFFKEIYPKNNNVKLAMSLSACGNRLAAPGNAGGVRQAPATSAGSAATVPFASGPIQSACVRSGRKGATRQLCGCVQAAADGTLSSRDQSLAVSFYGDPHRGQDVRQSDTPSNEAFWQRYKLFVARAERQCAAAR